MIDLKPIRKHQTLGAAGLFLASAFAAAQATPPQSIPPAQTDATAQTSNVDMPANATGKAPLANTDREGFWGHVNPFARKKWVNRQVDPIKDRVNELDELQAKNANDIKDVDARATSGITRAMTSAQAADAHAADAASRADQANSVAVAATAKTNSLNGTVSNLDQYQKVNAVLLPFYKGRTTLTVKQKVDLDDIATALANQKGYIVEVKGYSRAGVAPSQAMADSVVRYLVEAHQVPVYRIYRTGMGRSTEVASADGEQPLSNGVRVTVLQNSLATMSTNTSAPNPPASSASNSPVPTP